MGDTYSQIYIQLVFAVKYRAAVIAPEWKERLHQYITGIVQNSGHKMLQINSMPDHIHILVGIKPDQAISDLVKNVKTETSKWIKEHRFCGGSFAWQTGYGAFSYSKSQVPDVVKYIQEQEKHHQKFSFLNEYRKLLTAFHIDWKEEYIFKELE